MSRQNGLQVQPGDMLLRPRLHALIQNGLQQPLLVLLAAPGYGKTQAVASYLAKARTRALWIRLDSLDNLQTHFWAHLVQALRLAFPMLSERPSTPDFPGTTAQFHAFITILAEAPAGDKQVVGVVDDFGAITDSGVKVEGKILSGYAAQEILSFANTNDIDLIVMGTHGRTGIDRMLFGSVAEKVVKAAEMPVMTVRPTNS